MYALADVPTTPTSLVVPTTPTPSVAPPTATPSVVPSTSSHHDGNTTGIIIGCLFAFIICAILILLTLFFFIKWKRKKQKRKKTDNATLLGMYSISDEYMYIHFLFSCRIS